MVEEQRDSPMWLIVGLGGALAVVGLLLLAFPTRATELNTRFSTESAKRADPGHWWGRSGARVKAAGIVNLLVGVIVVVAGLAGGHRGG
jgi:uncharacterized membrane protein HdeD (DUF308 family)